MIAENLDLYSFQRWCIKSPVIKFYYAEKFQAKEEFRYDKLDMLFTSIEFMYAPNRVCLKNPYGTFTINDVKAVKHIIHNWKEERIGQSTDNNVEVFVVECNKNTLTKDNKFGIVAEIAKGK